MGVLSVPMAVEGASKTSAGDRGSCTGRHAAARHDMDAASYLRSEENLHAALARPGNSPAQGFQLRVRTLVMDAAGALSGP